MPVAADIGAPQPAEGTINAQLAANVTQVDGCTLKDAAPWKFNALTSKVVNSRTMVVDAASAPTDVTAMVGTSAAMDTALGNTASIEVQVSADAVQP